MMKTLSIITTLVVGLLAGAPAQATYTSIIADLVDLEPDTSYVGGVLSILSDTPGALTLYDPPNTFPGTFSNIIFELSTTLDHVFTDDDGDEVAVFKGGEVSLTFDYDEGSGPVTYFIGGPIDTLNAQVVLATPTLSIIGGAALFPPVWDLPGSNAWPKPNLLSSVKALNIGFWEDLSDFQWQTDLMDGFIESRVLLLPGLIPEPVTVVLWASGLLLVRRRER